MLLEDKESTCLRNISKGRKILFKIIFIEGETCRIIKKVTEIIKFTANLR